MNIYLIVNQYLMNFNNTVFHIIKNIRANWIN